MSLTVCMYPSDDVFLIIIGVLVDLFTSNENIIPSAVRIVDFVEDLRYILLAAGVQFVDNHQVRFIGEDLFVPIENEIRSRLRWCRRTGNRRSLTLSQRHSG